MIAYLNESAMGGNRLFGTSGIRGIVGQDLTIDLCHKVAQALGTSLAPQSSVCLATDTRQSRELIQETVTSGLLSTGINVVDAGILPTPALAWLTREMGFATGIMLTASHNPPQYNGIKLFNKDATGYSRSQELELERLYLAHKFRRGKGTLEQAHNVKQRYLAFIKHKFPLSRSNHNLKLVVDPGNGAASGFAPYIFTHMGLNVIPLNDAPDGLFPGRNPEPREDTLQGTVEFLRQRDADLAICFDGDADRVVFCDREGFLGFDPMIAFIARLMVQQTGRKKVATTIETGRLLDLALKHLDVEIVRGKVGDVNVAYLARELGAAIGVEPVGVYILPPAGYYPDSFLAALFLLNQLNNVAEIRKWLKSLPPLFRGKSKIPCPPNLKTRVAELCQAEAARFEPLQSSTLDGIRLDFPHSWLLIRPSGTEPIIRVQAEAESVSSMKQLMTQGINLVKEAITQSGGPT